MKVLSSILFVVVLLCCLTGCTSEPVQKELVPYEDSDYPCKISYPKDWTYKVTENETRRYVQFDNQDWVVMYLWMYEGTTADDVIEAYPKMLASAMKDIEVTEDQVDGEKHWVTYHYTLRKHKALNPGLCEERDLFIEKDGIVYQVTLAAYTSIIKDLDDLFGKIFASFETT